MKKKFINYLIILSVTLIFVNEKISAQMFWNNACSFSGTSSSYISRGNSTSLNITGSFTLEAWLNPVNATSPSFQIILQKREGANVTGYTLYLSNGKVSVRTGSTTRLVGKTVISNNNWTHVAGTYNSTSGLFSIYINGSLDTSATVAGAAPPAGTDSLFIGKGFNSPFGGQMDELRIWSRVLSSTEVNQFRRTTLGVGTGIYDGLELSYTFQDNDANGAAFILTDWTGKNNTGINRGVTGVDLSDRPYQTININDCIKLDGTNDYLSAPDNSAFSPTDELTLEAWIFPETISKNNVLIHKGSDDGSLIDYALNLYQGRLQAIINGKVTLTSDDDIPLSQWSHIAFVFDGVSGVTAFYINGVPKDVGINDKGFIPNGTDSLYIGGTGDLTDFDGYMDEVRIELYAKSEEDINQYLFKSIDESNDPAGTEAVYNLDGYAVSNAGSFNRLNFINNAVFANSGATNNQPISPIDRADDLNFQDGYLLKSSSKRIPATGTTGLMEEDTLNVLLNETITDVNVYIAINHNSENQLSITLYAPNGDNVILFNANTLVSNADNMITIFDDNADSSIVNDRYVSFSPMIRPLNNLNTAFSGDNSSGKWKLVVNDLSGSDTGRLYCWGIQFNNRASIPNLLSTSALIQGFYNDVSNLLVRDTMRFYLRYTAPPYEIRDSAKAYLRADGSASLTFNNAANGILYYIQLKHRNSIETWSSVPVVFDALTSQAEYNFTTSLSQAYGNNMIDVDNGPDRFAIYNGDVNQDDAVDITDGELIDNDLYNFASGYINTDLNGDQAIDVSDASIADNNIYNFVIAVTP